MIHISLKRSKLLHLKTKQAGILSVLICALFIVFIASNNSFSQPVNSQAGGFSIQETINARVKSLNITDEPIPKLIHMTVKNKTNLTLSVQENILSWKVLNPDYTFILYDDLDMDNLVSKQYPEFYPLVSSKSYIVL